MFKRKEYKIDGKVLVIDDRFELGYSALECTMRNFPRAVVITRLGKPIAMLVNPQNSKFWGADAFEKTMPCPMGLVESWQEYANGTMEPFAEMVAVSGVPLSFELGSTVGTALLLPVEGEGPFNLDKAMHLSKKEAPYFRYHMVKPFFEELGTTDMNIDYFEQFWDL